MDKRLYKSNMNKLIAALPFDSDLFNKISFYFAG